MTRLSSRHISQLHLYRVLHAVRRNDAPMSRGEIGASTGLSQPAVSSLTRRLLENGALVEVGARPSAGGGRKERELALNSDFVWVVGVNISLFQLTVTLTDFAGAVRATRNAPLETPMTKAALVRRVVREVRACLVDLGGVTLAGIGVALPGFVDSLGDLVHWSAVFSGSGRAAGLSEAIAAELGVPVFIENEAKIRALAEQWFGRAARSTHAAVITLDQGLGVGLILGGELYRGRAGLAGEMGHVQIVAGGRPCHCGKRGCLEAYVAHYAVVEQGREAGLLPASRPLLPQDIEPTYTRLAETGRRGGAKARAIFERQGRLLGTWLGNLINLLALQLVIVDGGQHLAIELLEGPLREALDEALALPHRGKVPVLIDHEGGEAWARGAAALVLQRLDESAEVMNIASRHGDDLNTTTTPAARRAAA
ncbi:ROK family transcriptional regulator [Pelomonas sp. KK5]|uniref:ROK family transcriptional regulator n=1 Tax=Pelomonas sp. KK5 TaxID=1855730 RepID=UPI00097C100E|nr:ROK family transcriptional regulator [Pelomonas sp. KK5]